MRFRKLKQQTKTQDKKTTKAHYAPYPLKIKALITDMFMIYAPILYITTYLVLNGKDEFQNSQIAPLIAVTLYGLIYALLLSKMGQTPGKKAYSLKVVDSNNGGNISFLRALLRFIIFLFSATIVLGLLLPLYRKDKKSLHDILCRTVEIKLNDE